VGLAVFVSDKGKPQRDPIIVLAREPQSSSVFDDAAKDVALRSLYEPAYSERGSSAGWCFIKVPFIIKGR
jgi:hypothetical protein